MKAITSSALTVFLFCTMMMSSTLAKNVLWKGGTGYCIGGPASALSPDGKYVVLSGDYAFGVYDASYPMKLLKQFDTNGINFGGKLPCFDDNGKWLYILGPNVEVYSVPDFKLTATYKILRGSGWPSDNLIAVDKLVYDAADSSIIVRTRYSPGATQIRSKVYIRAAGCTAERLDSAQYDFDCGSGNFVCKVNQLGGTITVYDLINSRVVDSIASPQPVWTAAANERYIFYYSTLDTIVVFDRTGRTTRAIDTHYPHAGYWPYSYLIPPQIDVINDSILLVSLYYYTALFNLNSCEYLNSLPFPCSNWLLFPTKQQIMLQPPHPFLSLCEKDEMPPVGYPEHDAWYTIVDFSGNVVATNTDDELSPRPDAVEYSRDSKLIAVRQNPNLTRIASVANGCVLCHISASGILCADASQLICYDKDTIKLYSTTDGKFERSFAISPIDQMKSMKCTSDGRFLFIASTSSIRGYAIATGSTVYSMLLPSGVSCRDIHLADYDSTLLILSNDTQLFRWQYNVASSNLYKITIGDSILPTNDQYSFSGDGSSLALQYKDEQSSSVFACVYSTRSGTRINRYLTDFNNVRQLELHLSYHAKYLFVDFSVGSSGHYAAQYSVYNAAREYSDTDSTLDAANWDSAIGVALFHRSLAPDEHSMIVWQDCDSPIQCIAQTISAVDDETPVLTNHPTCTYQNGYLRLFGVDARYKTVSVRNLLGQPVYTQTLDGAQNQTIPITSLVRGVYCVTLLGERDQVWQGLVLVD